MNLSDMEWDNRGGGSREHASLPGKWFVFRNKDGSGDYNIFSEHYGGERVRYAGLDHIEAQAIIYHLTQGVTCETDKYPARTADMDSAGR